MIWAGREFGNVNGFGGALNRPTLPQNRHPGRFFKTRFLFNAPEPGGSKISFPS
jgi:hypothetical protein